MTDLRFVSCCLEAEHHQLILCTLDKQRFKMESDGNPLHHFMISCGVDEGELGVCK